MVRKHNPTRYLGRVFALFPIFVGGAGILRGLLNVYRGHVHDGAVDIGMGVLFFIAAALAVQVCEYVPGRPFPLVRLLAVMGVAGLVSLLQI